MQENASHSVLFAFGTSGGSNLVTYLVDEPNKVVWPRLVFTCRHSPTGDDVIPLFNLPLIYGNQERTPRFGFAVAPVFPATLGLFLPGILENINEATLALATPVTPDILNTRKGRHFDRDADPINPNIGLAPKDVLAGYAARRGWVIRQPLCEAIKHLKGSNIIELLEPNRMGKHLKSIAQVLGIGRDHRF